MKAGKVVLTGFVLFFGTILLGGGCAGCYMKNSYNKAVTLDVGVQSAWGDVEVVLKRRYDLIDNLVNTVKGAASHEKETLQSVIAARNQARTATSPGDKAAAAASVTRAVRSLISVVNERYPDLKAQTGFNGLMIELEGSENRIAEKRKRYNEAVRALNSHIRAFPHSIAAGWADATKKEFFEAGEEAQEAPKVRF